MDASNLVELMQKSTENPKLEAYKGCGKPNILQSTLYTAIKNKSIGLVKQLLNSGGIDVNARDEDGRSLLYLAVLYKLEEIVELLLQQKGIDVNLGNNDNKTPLHVAASSELTEIARMLIDKGANVNAKAANGLTPLCITALSNKSIEISTLLIKARANVNYVAQGLITPLICAVVKNHEESIKLLIQYGADINFKCENDVSILYFAVLNGSEISVKTLIECKANIHYVSPEGLNLLYPAVLSENIDIIKLLVEKGLDINCVDNKGKSLFSLISQIKKFNKELFQELIKLGADVNKRDNKHFPPLYYAIVFQNEEMIAALIENGADVNQKIQCGFSGLHLAKLWHDKDTKIYKLISEKASTRTKLEAETSIMRPVYKISDLLSLFPKNIYKTASAIKDKGSKIISSKCKFLYKTTEVNISQPQNSKPTSNSNDNHAITVIFISYLVQYYLNSRNNSRVLKLLDNSANLTEDQISKLSSRILNAPGLRFICNAIIMTIALDCIDSSIEHWNETHDSGARLSSKYTYMKNSLYLATIGFFVASITSYGVNAWDITPQLTGYRVSQFIKQCCINVSYKYDQLLTNIFIPESICAVALCALSTFIGNKIDSRSSGTTQAL